MKVCIIFNPTARGEKARRFHDHLAALSSAVVLKPTYAAGSGRTLAAEATTEGFDSIVAAGGDGTVNEVLNGLGDAPEDFARVRFGVIPLGTINVFARELALPTDFASAWRVVQKGREMRVDLPEVEFELNGRRQRRYFAQLAGAGLDSRAIELVSLEQKKAIGPLAYVAAGFRALAERKTQITARSATGEATGELVLIGNGRFYGGSFKLFPNANLRDGLLDVTVFPRVDWRVVLRSGWGWLMDRIGAAAGCYTFQSATVSLASASPIPFELDGENIGPLPARFKVNPGALRVIVP